VIVYGTDHIAALALPAYGAIINDGELLKLANQWLAVRTTAWKDKHGLQRGKGR
jgi:hypothetical protein